MKVLYCFNIRFSVCSCTLHVTVRTDTHSARCNTHKWFPRNVIVWVCSRFPFTLTDHNIVVCASGLKPLSNKSVDWFSRVAIFKMFYISWPLLIIWLQVPVLCVKRAYMQTGSAGIYVTLEHRKFIWHHWSDLANVCMLPGGYSSSLWRISVVTFAVFGGDCTYGFSLPTE